jgi:hypothetical protein
MLSIIITIFDGPPAHAGPGCDPAQRDPDAAAGVGGCAMNFGTQTVGYGAAPEWAGELPGRKLPPSRVSRYGSSRAAVVLAELDPLQDALIL